MPVYVRYIDLSGYTYSYSLPERPNGYAVFVMADDDSPYKEKARVLANSLIEKGYTVLTAFRLKAHWGSPKAVAHARQVISLFIKQETVNKRIFICAEGASALIAKQLLADATLEVRAAALIKPVLSLEAAFQAIKKDELAGKRFLKEVKAAYKLNGQIDVAYLRAIDQQQRLIDRNRPLAATRIYQLFSEATAQPTNLSSAQYADYYFLASLQNPAELSKQMASFFASFH
ncbi:hypothetical protein [Shouchella clausii]|uniref:Alpha/beta hydrolase n=1 Tax=Shouchella clausii TaxID=79880 RepID=A0A268P2P4_SHOCL|nr:hypothetical protein [Shouchella clausii]PAE89530.1 hypothetical protein CHH72_07780 [Shouchella clausii]